MKLCLLVHACVWQGQVGQGIGLIFWRLLLGGSLKVPLPLITTIRGAGLIQGGAPVQVCAGYARSPVGIWS